MHIIDIGKVSAILAMEVNHLLWYFSITTMGNDNPSTGSLLKFLQLPFSLYSHDLRFLFHHNLMEK